MYMYVYIDDRRSWLMTYNIITSIYMNNKIRPFNKTVYIP